MRKKPGISLLIHCVDVALQVDGQTNETRGIVQGTGDGLSYPPDGIGRKVQMTRWVKPLNGLE